MTDSASPAPLPATDAPGDGPGLRAIQAIAAEREPAERNPQERILQLERALDIAIESLATCRDREAEYQQMSDRLAEAEATAAVQHQAILQLKQQLQQQKTARQTRIHDLERQLTERETMEAQFQHAYRDLETELAQAQGRSADLERQLAELQEQILHQAQQAKEYETAIQHWKDRCAALEREFQAIARQADGGSGHDSARPSAGDLGRSRGPSGSGASGPTAGHPFSGGIDLPSFVARPRSGTG